MKAAPALVRSLLEQAWALGAHRVVLQPTPGDTRVHFRGGPRREPGSCSRDAPRSLVEHLRRLAGRPGGEPLRALEQAWIRVPGVRPPVVLGYRAAPTAFGPSLALDLAPAPLRMGLGRLGLEEVQRQALAAATGMDRGVILVSGPTQSGRSGTLYSLLAESVRADRVVMTAEHTIHRPLVGATQCPVGDGRGASAAARMARRAGADVLFLSETRFWSEAIPEALRFARDGGLLLLNGSGATAAEALWLLGYLAFGVSLRDLPLVVVNQRLLRGVCPGCRVRVRPEVGLLEAMGVDAAFLEAAAVAWPGSPPSLDQVWVAEGRGCRACAGRGVRGWTGAFELLVHDPAGPGTAPGDLEARRVGPALREHGLRTLLRGAVSLREVQRALY